MTKFYKIKVGIEEYTVNEIDIPRIVEAMKNNDMVKLECGIFRGNAILAVCEDIEKTSAFDSLPPPKTDEELKQDELQKIRKEKRLNCDICSHTGMKEELRKSKFGYEELIRVPCDCQIIN